LIDTNRFKLIMQVFNCFCNQLCQKFSAPPFKKGGAKKRKEEKKTKDQISTRSYRTQRKPILVSVIVSEGLKVNIKMPADEPTDQRPPRPQARLVKFPRHNWPAE